MYTYIRITQNGTQMATIVKNHCSNDPPNFSMYWEEALTAIKHTSTVKKKKKVISRIKTSKRDH